MTNTVDQAKLASYRAGLSHLGERERTIYTRSLHQGRSSPLVPDATTTPPHPDDSEALDRAIARLLKAIGAPDHVVSKRLADVLATAIQEGTREEEEILQELRLLDRMATPPEAWGKYKILGMLGAGGFGAVYKAWDADLQQTLALKLYHADQSRRTKDELLAEARKLVRVRHANVVDVHYADEHDGIVGVCMELIQGQTLAQVIHAQGSLGPEEAATIGATLCQALAAVHHADLTHGDIKAENVMREAGGRIVLMDFGSARFRDPDVVQAEGISGTPRYMAPELLAFEKPTNQSDIYALGVLLFHLVTGRFPVEAKSITSLQRAHQDGGDRLLLRDVRPGLPTPFVDAVERALSADRVERFETVGQMEQALSHAVPAAVPRRLDLAAIALSIIGVMAALWALGFVTSGAFRVFLRVPEQFDPAGLSVVWGLRPMVPVLFYWCYLTFGLAIAIGLATLASAVVVRLSRRGGRAPDEASAGRALVAAFVAFAVGSLLWSAVTWSQSTWPSAAMELAIEWVVGVPLLIAAARRASAPSHVQHVASARFARRLIAFFEPAPESAVLRAAALFSVAAICWLALTWSQIGVFRALVALTALPAADPGGPSIFVPLSAEPQRFYVQAYAKLSFALLFAIWRLRRLEAAGTPEPIRFLRWALVIVVGLTLAMTAVPYRISWVDYERVEHDGRPAFIVGETDQQVHLVFPPDTGVVNRTVRRDDPRLMPSGMYEKLFAER